MDHVVTNYGSTTCDLWEEIRSDDLFWNKFTMRKALVLGSEFATSMKDSTRANSYSQTAKLLESILLAHWNKSFLWEATIRPVDGSVIHAINVAYRQTKTDTFISVLDPMVASTVASYNSSFCKEYPINVTDNDAKIPGIL